MDKFIGALIGALAEFVGPAVGRMLLALGISAITYTGVSAGLTALEQMAIAKFQGLPSDVLNLMSLLGIDVAITIIFSAYSFKISLRATGGVIKKMVAK
jgi:hypothetical protein